ncbi:MAG: gluconokinase [Aridibacter famidurans]|nr:gluconokinase [Aridibacter famidurans]
MPPDESPYFLSIDIGTSGVRSSLFDSSGNELEGPRSVRRSPDPDDPSEFDPETFLQLVIECLDDVHAGCDEGGINPVFAGVSCFWHGLLGVDAAGDPVTPISTWADTRASYAADYLRTRLDENAIQEATGCHFHSSFWPAKLVRLRETEPETFERARKWISFADFLQLRLNGELVTSVSMASGTGLFDQRRCTWDEGLALECGVSIGKLPELAPDGASGRLIPEFRNRWPRFSETRWFPAIGDGAANNLGANCVGNERAALMIGTSAALRCVFEGDVPESIPEGLFCYRLDRRRIVLGGALSDGGSLHRWLTDTLGLDVDDASLEQRYLERPPGYHGLAFLPFVFGERGTGYHSDARGTVIGITRGTDAEDIVLAAMEGIAFRLAEILTRMERVTKPKEIVVSGGAIENSAYLAQLVADVLGRDVLRTETGLASLRGAALFASEQAGFGPPTARSGEQGESVQFDPDRHRTYLAAFERHSRFYARMFRRG